MTQIYWQSARVRQIFSCRSVNRKLFSGRRLPPNFSSFVFAHKTVCDFIFGSKKCYNLCLFLFQVNGQKTRVFFQAFSFYFEGFSVRDVLMRTFNDEIWKSTQQNKSPSIVY